MLKINVGLSRKITEDYNSRGFSLNIEGELPSDILADQKSLMESTNRLFAVANLMLDEQVRKATSPEADIQHERANRNGNGHPANGNGRAYGNTRGNGSNGNGHRDNNGQNGERLLTQAQFRALTTMSRKLDLNVDDWARNEFGVNKLGDLTVKQASLAIDALKREIEANTSGSGR